MAFPCRVDRPVFSPHTCVVLGKGDDPRGWLDLGNVRTSQPDPRAYLSHGGVLTAAKEFGYDLLALQQEADRAVQLERELEQARAEISELEQFAQAIDVIESREFRARRKPGRKATV